MSITSPSSDGEAVPARAQQAPARSIYKSVAYRTVGGFSAPHLAPYTLEWESHLELSFLSLLVLASDVEFIATQSEWISYRLGGKLSEKLPDLMLKVAGQDIYVEIKPLARLYQPRTLDVHAEFARHMNSVGARLVFLTDDQLPDSIACANAEFFRRYLKSTYLATEETAVQQALSARPMSISDLCDHTGLSVRTIHTLVSRRRIAMNWAERLSLETVVHWVGEDGNGISFNSIANSGRFHPCLKRLALGYRPTDQREIALAQIDRRGVRPVRTPSIV